jgi:putative flavoprotein involved in K+ transport
MRFPAPPHYFPSKDEMADNPQTYAEEFELPVRSAVVVERLSREEGAWWPVPANTDSKTGRQLK